MLLGVQEQMFSYSEGVQLLGQIQDLVRGGSYKCPPTLSKALFTWHKLTWVRPGLVSVM